MGACVSSLKGDKSTIKRDKKVSFLSSGGFKTPNCGSKDEAYFDSNPYLDSEEGEDDFLSVNGDLTPSAGNTPKSKNTTPTTPELNKILTNTSSLNDSESCPRKKLSELLSEDKSSESATNSNHSGRTPNGKKKAPKLTNKSHQKEMKKEQQTTEVNNGG